MGNGVFHIVMFPFLAFGHMIPFVHLSIALAKAGIRVSFISTPKAIKRLPKVPLDMEALITFVEFHLPKVEGLPEGAEFTSDINSHQFPYLQIAYDLMRDQFKAFLQKADQFPDLIIQDFFPYWTTNITEEFNIPRVMLSVFSAAMLSYHGPPDDQNEQGHRKHWPTPESMTCTPKWITFPSTVAYRLYEANKMFAIKQSHPNVLSQEEDGDRLAQAFRTCHAVAIRSCYELEGEYLELLKSMYQKPVIPIGVLPPTKDEKKDKTLIQAEILTWLNLQKPKSVVYVAFGNEAKLKEDQIHAIAKGLEKAKQPFFWVFKKPLWVLGDDDDGLPLGFRSRAAEFGMVFMGWAPQSEILAHPSIGGSLFHSGWGSIIETLQHGHTPIVLPLIYDQQLNCKLLVDNGLAVEVDRREEDGSFNEDDIARTLNKAMEDEDLRARAGNMKAVFGDEELQYEHYLGPNAIHVFRGCFKLACHGIKCPNAKNGNITT